MFILSLPLILEGQSSVTGERVATEYSLTQQHVIQSTCLQRPLKGMAKSGLCSQVVSVQRVLFTEQNHIIFSLKFCANYVDILSMFINLQ